MSLGLRLSCGLNKYGLVTEGQEEKLFRPLDNVKAESCEAVNLEGWHRIPLYLSLLKSSSPDMSFSCIRSISCSNVSIASPYALRVPKTPRAVKSFLGYFFGLFLDLFHKARFLEKELAGTACHACGLG